MKNSKGLTPRQERFLGEYLTDLNGTAAYRRAFPACSYNTARTEAARLLANPCIRSELAAARRDVKRLTQATAERVIQEIAAIAFADVFDLFDHTPDGLALRSFRDVPPEARRAIASLKVKRVVTRTRTTDGGETVTETVDVIQVRLAQKLAALDKLARHLGLYEERPPLTVLMNSLPSSVAKELRKSVLNVSDETPE